MEGSYFLSSLNSSSHIINQEEESNGGERREQPVKTSATESAVVARPSIGRRADSRHIVASESGSCERGRERLRLESSASASSPPSSLLFHPLTSSPPSVSCVARYHSPQNIPWNECCCCEQPIQTAKKSYCNFFGCSQ